MLSWLLSKLGYWPKAYFEMAYLEGFKHGAKKTFDHFTKQEPDVSAKIISLAEYKLERLKR